MNPGEILSFERAESERVNAVLRRYHGGYAQLWEYTVSLRKLTIRVTPDGMGKNCHLLCGDCRYISCPSDWESARLEIELDEDRELYVLVDADVHVSFGAISVLEDVEPVF